jgi:hypothetical protein
VRARQRAESVIVDALVRAPLEILINDELCEPTAVAVVVLDALEEQGWKLVPPDMEKDELER